jgi:hypothetical protein
LGPYFIFCIIFSHLGIISFRRDDLHKISVICLKAKQRPSSYHPNRRAESKTKIAKAESPLGCHTTSQNVEFEASWKLSGSVKWAGCGGLSLVSARASFGEFSCELLGLQSKTNRVTSIRMSEQTSVLQMLIGSAVLFLFVSSAEFMFSVRQIKSGPG